MKKLLALFTKYREAITYLFFGGLATLLNLVLYALFSYLFGYRAANGWANILNTVLCILFAYATNRTFVFRSRTKGKEALREFAVFFGCRLGTLVLDAAVMYLGGNVLGPALVPEQWLALWGVGVKVFSNVLVVIFNYVFSKLIIFKNK